MMGMVVVAAACFPAAQRQAFWRHGLVEAPKAGQKRVSANNAGARMVGSGIK